MAAASPIPARAGHGVQGSGGGLPGRGALGPGLEGGRSRGLGEGQCWMGAWPSYRAPD